MSPPLPTCPRCGAQRILAPECPHCGVIYAKASARPARPPARPEDPPASAPTEGGYAAGVWGSPAPAEVEDPSPFEVEEERLEAMHRLLSLPAVLGGVWLAMSMPMLGWLAQIFLAMWVHELGHAVTAWLCGFSAVPLPWFTSIADSRSVMVSLLVAGLMGTWGWRSLQARRWSSVALVAVVLGLQLVGTLLLPVSRARMMITFGGDGGAMVLGSLLMATLYASPESELRRRWLHWGFAVIGAAGFIGGFDTWWEARTDFAAIPFGMQEGRTLSDASKLVDWHGWDELDMIRRHVRLGLACLAGLAVLYAVGLWRSRGALGELAREMKQSLARGA